MIKERDCKDQPNYRPAVTNLSNYHVVEVNERIINSHNFDPFLDAGSEDQAPNAAESAGENKPIC